MRSRDTSPALDLRARHIAIVHGWRDELIPPEDVFALALRSRADLRFIDSDHRLSDVVPAIERDFAAFLDRVTASAK